MIAYLEKAFNVRRDELAPALLLFLYLFFAIGCYIMGQSVGDALFLSVFPSYLPQGIQEGFAVTFPRSSLPQSAAAPLRRLSAGRRWKGR